MKLAVQIDSAPASALLNAPGRRIASAATSLRARAAGVESAAAADISGLAKVLDDEGVSLRPLFGASEERVLASAARAFGAPVQEMARFYRVDAPDARLDSLAAKL